MKKVILNKCYGGFDVSYEAYKLYAKKKYNVDKIFVYDFNYVDDEAYYVKSKNDEGCLLHSYSLEDLGDKVSSNDFNGFILDEENREDEILIEVVEELGDDASGKFGKLVVVEIPDNLDYVIDDYDGIETLHQKVQEW